MQMTSKLTLLLASAGCVAISACSSATTRPSGFDDQEANNHDTAAAPATDGTSAEAGPAFGDTDSGAGGGGTAVCAPSPGNFEVPANGCDDDADGKVDNADVACDSGLTVTGGANDFAKALGLCVTATGPSDKKWGVISSAYTRGYNQTAAPEAGQHGLLGKFGSVVKPREGSTLGVLSTGWAREYDGDTGTTAFQGGKMMTNSGAVPSGYPKAATGCTIRTDVHDVISLKLSIKVPDNAQGVAFDFNFHSGEWPQFVCTKYNDGFIAYLSSSAFNGGKPENISFDAQNNPVSVNNGFFDHCTPNTQTGCSGGKLKTATCSGGETELAGTGFASKGQYCNNTTSTGGGATGWLTSQAPVKPGEVITLELMIWDTGDSNFDSSVLLDHITWSPTPTVTKTDRPK